jgi:diguanylate cyclase (GGDEF)-like protein/PAS domain S-box-containing protein
MVMVSQAEIYIMNDIRKTKEQLIRELGDLRRRIAELERSEIESKQAEQKLNESKENYRNFFRNANEAIFVGLDSKIVFHNPKTTMILGHSAEELVSRPISEFIHRDDRDMVIDCFVRQITGEKVPQNYDFRIIQKDGSIRWVVVNSRLINWEGKQATLNFLSDITDRKQLEERLRAMSIMDDLTGLYNRRGFLTLFQQQVKVADRTKKNMLLFFADLDKMKQINDTLGHQEGDKALIEIATILKEVFRESDIIGRMGGDEFAILVLDTTDETKEVLLKRLLNYLDDYNRSRSYTLSLSIGIAPYDPKKPLSLDDLMAQADTLMYEEKRNKQH